MIDIKAVSVRSDRARRLDPMWVEALAQTIDTEGLINPISVREIEGGYELIAGGHRLAACKDLNWKKVAAHIYPPDFSDADLIETIENLIRHELTALDRARHIVRFREAYTKKHGPIERGGDRRSESPADQSPEFGLWSFHELIADKTGLSRSTIFSNIAMWKALLPGGYERISELPTIADNFSQLKLLSDQSHDRQEAVLGLIETNDAIATVADAIKSIDNIKPTPIAEKKLTVARGAWVRLNQQQRMTFLEGCEDEVRRFAELRGWIIGDAT